ncbi:MAG: alpha/beta fold hydrolase [Acidimicrobiales bacterium]
MRIETDGVGLEVTIEGEGPPVVLLHGWPDTHELWAGQTAALSAAGYQVIAPDLRGLGASDKPEGVDAYNILLLAGDVLGVLDHLGIEKAHVVGHDWGAALAWAIAAFMPDRVDHLVCLSVGHPAAFAGAGFGQRQLSWYMLLFQFEGVAEQWLSMDDFTNMREWSHHPQLDQITPRLSEPGALTASLNWYRANVAPESLVQPAIEFPPVAAPTMGIWGSNDFALGREQMEGSAAFVSGPWRLEVLEGRDHWLMLEDPDRVNELLLDFLPSP